MMEELNEKLTDLEEDLMLDDYGFCLEVMELKNREKGGHGLGDYDGGGIVNL
jgi:hypothetical protein